MNIHVKGSVGGLFASLLSDSVFLACTGTCSAQSFIGMHAHEADGRSNSLHLMMKCFHTLVHSHNFMDLAHLYCCIAWAQVGQGRAAHRHTSARHTCYRLTGADVDVATYIEGLHLEINIVPAIHMQRKQSYEDHHHQCREMRRDTQHSTDPDSHHSHPPPRHAREPTQGHPTQPPRNRSLTLLLRPQSPPKIASKPVLRD